MDSVMITRVVSGAIVVILLFILIYRRRSKAR